MANELMAGQNITDARYDEYSRFIFQSFYWPK